MTAVSTIKKPLISITQVLLQILVGLGIAAVIVTVVAAVMLVNFEFQYAGRIYPGVSVGGINLSGLTPSEAVERINQNFSYPKTGKIVLKDKDRLWFVNPSELGLLIEAGASARTAYDMGRQGDFFSQLYDQYLSYAQGEDLPLQVIYDQRQAENYLRGIAGEIDIPTIEASIKVTGLEVEVTPGQIGRHLDIITTMEPFKDQLISLSDGLFVLVVEESPPAILDVSEQANIAERILSRPLVINIPDQIEGDPGPWSYEADAIAKMLTIERVDTPEGSKYQVGLNAETLRPFLESLAPGLMIESVNARMIFNDDTRELEVIEPAVIGRELDIEGSIKSINEQLVEGKHEIPLTITRIDPPVTDTTTAKELGIIEPVSVQSSYYYGSSSGRMQNIQTASAQFHGIFIPPGATFSMADALGDVSLDNGYAEALIIFNNRTIKGVGGGVCQVSTTLFRTVFFGGFPVEERHPHAYRVTYYEKTYDNRIDSRLAGLDATVYVPIVDFKFVNDTPYWLLMETYVNIPSRVLTWKFYSTSDGRSVNWTTTGLKNVVEPDDPEYIENPDLKKGEIKQVDWAVKGADVSINRTVMRDDEVYFSDWFSTHYLPWKAVYEYGPGTKIPKQDKKPTPTPTP